MKYDNIIPAKFLSRRNRFVAEAEIAIPAIDAGATGHVTFRADVDEDAIDGILNYNLEAESGHYADRLESNVILGYTSEDFDDETLNEDLQWNLGPGHKKWNVVEDATAEGGHCLRSPTLADKASSNVFIGITTETAGTFSFNYKTSTDDGDMLILTLNNNELGSWSGISEWERAEYVIPAGTNLIRFSFKKDDEGSDGEDAVMVDQLHFPPFAKMVLYAGNDMETCPNFTFTPDSYIYNQTDFTWSTNGDGTFDDATLEQPTYTFGETDKAEGHVELTLTGTSTFDGSQQSSTVTVSILPYFGTNYTPETPLGAVEVDQRLVSQSEYTGEEIEDVIYTWTLEPSTAGTLTHDGHHALVEWNGEYRGQVSISYAYENPCGSTSTSEPLSVNVFNSTGMDEQLASRVEVYPNPATNIVHIKTNVEGKAMLRVIDLSGKVVYSCNMMNDECGIETSKFGGGGIYTLQVIQNDMVTNIRFVVMP